MPVIQRFEAVDISGFWLLRPNLFIHFCFPFFYWIGTVELEMVIGTIDQTVMYYVPICTKKNRDTGNVMLQINHAVAIVMNSFDL